MHEQEPKPVGDIEPTTADILYDAVQKIVEEWGAISRDRHITDYSASTDDVDESFVGFIDGDNALSFRFHVDDINTATLDGVVAYPGYSEISLGLWRGDDPAELDADNGNGIDNYYSVILLEGQTPFLAKTEELDGYFSLEDLATQPHKSKMAGVEYFLDMAKHGHATMRLLDDGSCAELLEALSNPNLSEYMTSD